MAKTNTPPPSIEQEEMVKLEQQFDKFDNEVKSMTMDRMKTAPSEDREQQTKLSQKEIEKSKDIYIKAHRTIGCQEKFNEKYRDDYEFSKEYVHFTAENLEIIGEELDFWTKPFPGVPAQEWKIPVNKPVWCHRFVAERIKGCKYHVMSMQNTLTDSSSSGQFYGTMVVDKTKQRLDATPVSQRKSVFMGAGTF